MKPSNDNRAWWTSWQPVEIVLQVLAVAAFVAVVALMAAKVVSG